MTIWYHQDLFRIARGRGRDGVIRQRYAELTGLPVVPITGGTYTGVAATGPQRLARPGRGVHRRARPDAQRRRSRRAAAAVLTIAGESN